MPELREPPHKRSKLVTTEMEATAMLASRHHDNFFVRSNIDATLKQQTHQEWRMPFDGNSHDCQSLQKLVTKSPNLSRSESKCAPKMELNFVLMSGTLIALNRFSPGPGGWSSYTRGMGLHEANAKCQTANSGDNVTPKQEVAAQVCTLLLKP